MEKKQITKCIEYYIDSRTCKDINEEISNIQEIKYKPANREVKYEYRLNEFGVYEVKVYFTQNKIDWEKTFDKNEKVSDKKENNQIKIVKNLNKDGKSSIYKNTKSDTNKSFSLVDKNVFDLLIINTKRTLSTTIFNLKETLSKTFISIGRTFSKYRMKFKIYLTPEEKLAIYSGDRKYGKYKQTKGEYKPY